MNLWQDVRFAIRLLWKDRWFTLAAVLTLSLGMGANAAVFTFVNAVLIRSLPFEEPDRLVSIWTEDERGRRNSVSPSTFADWREQSRTMSNLAAMLGSVINVADEGRPAEQFQGSYVSANLFRMIGARPAIGRGFLDDDDRIGAPPVVLLGHGIWQNRYGSDPDILGKTIRVNSKAATVVGVMAPDMMFPSNDALWIPAMQLPPDSLDPRRDNRSFNVLGQLAPGATLAQAKSEFRVIGQALGERYPPDKEFRPVMMLYRERMNANGPATMFKALMGAVAFVLLIACANVSNLLLARSGKRTREVAVRAALGAGRWRIVRQLLIESLLLAAMSGALGLVFALGGIRWFDAATQDVGKPYWMTFDLDPIVFAFIAAVCLLTTIVFGLAPALQVSRTDANEVLKEGGRGGTSGRRARRWTSVLVVTELVLTVVLLAGAGYMMKSFLTLYGTEVGVETSNLLTMQIYLPLTKYPQPAPRTVVYEQFEERLKGLNALEATALMSNYPAGGGYLRLLSVEGRAVPDDPQKPEVGLVTVGDSYFDALKLRLVRGRAFRSDDGLPGHEAAVINQRFAAMHFPNQDPIGQRIRLSIANQKNVPAWTTVVGIAPNVRQRRVQQEAQADPVVYLPYRADPQRTAFLLVRTRGDVASVTQAVRESMRAVEPDVPLYNIRTLDVLMARDRWPYVVFGSMFTLFAVIALVLSAVGLYSVTAYTVTQRTQEIGIRMALGALPDRVMWMVLRRGLLELLVGLPMGLAGAWGVGKVIEGLLVQTRPGDLTTLVAVVLLLAVVAMLACLKPARRAARLDPVNALRYD